MSNKIIIGGIVLGAVSLLIFGGRYSANDSVSRSASVHNGVARGTASQNNLASDFTLQKLGGGTITLSEFRGKKAVGVDFWASWCPNCRRDMPKMNAMYPKYQDKVEIIGVNLQESESTVQDFIASRGISFPIALDPSGHVSRAYGIQYTNTHFLINKEGDLVRQIPGDIRESDIISLIEQNQ